MATAADGDGGASSRVLMSGAPACWRTGPDEAAGGALGGGSGPPRRGGSRRGAWVPEVAGGRTRRGGCGVA
ncbi:hypothetical protein [Frankia tisae]|uniref:hypothetical protein n=1 Tax=Frankia tisae TaxID=2950104 RepID=UPI0021BF048A|nr:hypothetical protein [Frankia tisae]